MTHKIELFTSYSHNDEKLRDELENHLSLLKRQGVIESWHDRKIDPGKEWKKQIDEHINIANIILLLVSADFIASDYCYANEMVRALERHEKKEAIVIPIIIRPVDWKRSPFAKLQALPKDGRPVTTWQIRDEAWVNVVEGIRHAIDEIRTSKTCEKIPHQPIILREILINEFRRLEETVGEGLLGGFPTGLVDLDTMTDGLHPADFYIVAGRPSMGKIDLLVNISSQIAVISNNPILFFSMKLSAQQITRRFTCLLASISSQALLRGFMKEKDWHRLTEAANRLSEAPIFIDDRPIITVDEIISQTHRINEKNKIGLLVIDDLQHITMGKDAKDWSYISMTIKSLRALAKEIEVPLIATSEVLSDVDRRISKRPTLGDFGRWDILTADANVILFLYRDEIYEPMNSNRGIAELIVAKNEYGPTGRTTLHYVPTEARFANLDVGDTPETQTEEHIS